MHDNKKLSSAIKGAAPGWRSYSQRKVHLAARMLFRQQDGLLPRGDVGIDLRRGNGAVAQQGLDVPDVHPRLQQSRRKGVPEHVRRHVTGRPGPFQVLCDDLPDGLRRQPPPAAVQKDRAGGPDLLRIDAAVFSGDSHDLRRRDLDDPLLSPLALDQQAQPVPVELERIRAQFAQLGDPDPRAEQQLKHQNIPQGGGPFGGVGIVGALEQALHDVVRDHARELLGRMDTDVQLFKWTFRDPSAQLQLVKKGAQTGQLPLHRARRERLVQVPNVPVDGVHVDFSTLGKIQKLGKINAIGLDRVRRELLFIFAHFKIGNYKL